MIEVVKPVIEWCDERMIDMPFIRIPDNAYYDEWASAISEGWCPPDRMGTTDGIQGELAQVSIIATREQWLRCPHGVMFRLVYDQLEDL